MIRKRNHFTFAAWLFSLSALLHVPAASAQAVAATGKALMVERLYSPPSLSGRLTQGIEWAPDRKRLSYLGRRGSGKDVAIELWAMDAATGERKILVNADTMKAVMQPEKEIAIQAATN
jgi:dipeptidyl-peptidase 4